MQKLFDYEYWGFNTQSISQNMALEEYLLERSKSSNKATIRFWNVDKDAVVLGYAESDSAIKYRDQTFDITRRITGGSHVQFDENCLAYSFTVPRNAAFAHYDEMRNYFADKIGSALSSLGVGDIKTDNKASTINLDGKVVASHAIFWGVKSALMHGLVVIDPYNVDVIERRMNLSNRNLGKTVYSEYDALKNIPALSGVVKKYVDYSNKKLKRELVKKLVIKKILDGITAENYENKTLTTSLRDEADSMVANRHEGESWTKEREPPYTEKEVESIPGEELSGDLKKDLGYCLYLQVSDKDFASMAYKN